MAMDIQSFAALLVAGLACATDLRTRRIPNVLTFGAPIAAVAFAAATAGWAGVGSALAGWAVGCALFFPLFALRGLGAGDVKLLAALGAWLGPAPVALVGIYAAIAGGVIALVVSFHTGYLRTAFRNIGALLMFWKTVGLRPAPELTLESASGPRLAYAVPVFTGLMVMLWLQ